MLKSQTSDQYETQRLYITLSSSE